MGPQNHLTYRPPAVVEPPAPRLFARVRSRNALEIRENLAAGELEAVLKREARARERQLALRLYLTLCTWRGFRRLLHFVAGSVVTIPILNFLLTPLGFRE